MPLTVCLHRMFLPVSCFLRCLPLIFLLQSCTEPESINPGLLPPADLLLVNNGTIKNGIISATRSTEAPRSDETPENLLGSFHDAETGRFAAGFLCQFLMEQNNPNFGSSPICDSLILSVPFSGGAYGFDNRLQGLQKIKIYALNKAIFKDSVYYSNVNPASFCDLANPIASLVSYRDAYPAGTAEFKVALPVSLGQNWLNNPAEFVTNQTFVNYFKGLLLRPEFPDQEAGTGGVWNLSPLRTAAPAKISLYYHQSSSPQLPETFSFPVTGDCARINFFETLAGAQVNAQLSDSTLGKQVLFGLPGTTAPVFYFPFLQSLRDTFSGGIHKAELIVPVKPGSISNFSNPASLSMQAKNASGSWVPISEISIGASFFNGNFEPAANRYRFNISVYLQEILNQKRPDNGLRIMLKNPGASPEVFTLLGSDQVNLNLTLSKE